MGRAQGAGQERVDQRASHGILFAIRDRNWVRFAKRNPRAPNLAAQERQERSTPRALERNQAALMIVDALFYRRGESLGRRGHEEQRVGLGDNRSRISFLMEVTSSFKEPTSSSTFRMRSRPACSAISSSSFGSTRPNLPDPPDPPSIAGSHSGRPQRGRTGERDSPRISRPQRARLARRKSRESSRPSH
jgi:hypothetical protein